MIEYLTPWNSIFLLKSQTPFYEISGSRGYIDSIEIWRILWFMVYLNLWVSLIRTISIDQLVKDYSQRPNVGLETVRVAFMNFRSHSYGSSNLRIRFRNITVELSCKSEICNFDLLFIQKYVIVLEISMNNIFFVKSFKPIYDLFKKYNCLLLSQLTIFLHVLNVISHRPSFTIFHDNH